MQSQSTKVERCCERCGAPFLTYPSWIARGRGRFCGRPCAIASFAPKRKAGVAIPRSCEQCNAPFRTYQSTIERGFGRFCTRECSQLSRRQGATIICRRCGASVYRGPQTIQMNYCSRKCRTAFLQASANAGTERRFWSYVDKDGPIPQHCPDLGPCWVWTAYRNSHRRFYGIFIVRKKTGYAHRYSWTLHHGPIPEGMQVLHHCDNPPCCNPAHLFLGTQQDNMNDMWAKGRAAAQTGTLAAALRR